MSFSMNGIILVANTTFREKLVTVVAINRIFRIPFIMLKVVGASWVQTYVSCSIIVGIIFVGIVTIIYYTHVNCVPDDGNYAAVVSWYPDSIGYNIEFLGQNNKPSDIQKSVARAYYQANPDATGWSVLEIETDKRYPDNVQAFASGMLEGSLCWQHIYWQWQNTVEETCEEREEFCQDMREFLDNNTERIIDTAEKYDKTDAFWHQINLFYQQLKGLEYGWNMAVERSRKSYEIPSQDFLWMNIAADLKDFEKFMNSSTTNYTTPITAMALLKLTEDGGVWNETKFVLAHASSASYSAMLRFQKKYKFGYHTTGKWNAPLVPGQSISFTSYPGAIHSQDDFYQITTGNASKINVVGTEIPAFNAKRWPSIAVHEQILMGPRIMAANRLGRDGRSWANIVKKYNSGTGNKQWLHVKTTAVGKNFTLWVLEQVPGKVVDADETATLRNQTFWISCGLPHFKDIGNSSEKLKYEINQLPLFRTLYEGQKTVRDVESAINLMRGPDLTLIGRTDLFAKSAEFYDQRNFTQVISNGVKTFKSSFSVRIQNFTSSGNKSVYLGRGDELSIRFQVPLKWVKLKQVITVNQPVSLKVVDEIELATFKNDSYVLRHVSQGKKVKIKECSHEGVIDLKIAQNREHFYAIAGPPWYVGRKRRIRPFQWSNSPLAYLPHYGHPDIWNFGCVRMNYVWP